MAVTAELAEYLPAGHEFTVSVKLDDPSIVAGYHLVFGYDQDKAELVSVEKGSMFETAKQSLFFVNAKTADIDITGATFDRDAVYAGNEVAQITLRSKVAGPLTLENVDLEIRDMNNQSFEVAFNTVATTNGIIPDAFALSQNYPNPFNPTTTIQLSLPTASDYKLTIYNIAGQVVQEYSGYSEAGIITVNWDASDVSSGIYLYKMEADEFSATKKMVLLK